MNLWVVWSNSVRVLANCVADTSLIQNQNHKSIDAPLQGLYCSDGNGIDSRQRTPCPESWFLILEYDGLRVCLRSIRCLIKSWSQVRHRFPFCLILFFHPVSNRSWIHIKTLGNFLNLSLQTNVIRALMSVKMVLIYRAALGWKPT